MSEFKVQTAKAKWSVSLDVDCPYCEHYFDILADGYVERLPSICEVVDSLEIEINCPKCGTMFILDKTEY